MNWEEVGAIGQVLGSIAVFITLGYLSIQVRQAREEVRRSISQNRAEGVLQLHHNRMSNLHLHSCLVKADMAFGVECGPFTTQVMQRAGLTLEDAAAVFGFETSWWQFYAQAIPYTDQMRAGERTQFDNGVRNHYTTPVSALWYEVRKHSLDPEAVRYVDNLLAQPAPSAS